MNTTFRNGLALAFCFALAVSLHLEAGAANNEGTEDWPLYLANTRSFELPGDILVRQHEQIDNYFLNRIQQTPALRDRLWDPVFSSQEAYRESLQKHRSNLREMLGLMEDLPQTLETGRLVISDESVRVEEVRVSIDSGFEARALIFSPNSSVRKPAIIAVPSEQETREGFAGIVKGQTPAGWVTQLLSSGTVVAIPLMVERSFDHELASLSWRAKMNRRQLLHRVGFVIGRPLVGLEVQQVVALGRALSLFKDIDPDRIGVMGIGQGGMTALYAAAVDERFAAAAAIDYFQARESCWKEPVDRMLYGQLNEFGDAEAAALVAPRPLIVLSHSSGPISVSSVENEAGRAHRFYDGLGLSGNLQVAQGADPLNSGARQLSSLLGSTQNSGTGAFSFRVSQDQVEDARNEHFHSLYHYLRRQCEESDAIRERFWQLDSASEADRPQRVEALHSELKKLMGEVSTEGVPLNARTHLIEANDRFAAYDVLLDVVPGVEAWGHLLIPRGIEGLAPAVVAQHGGGGLPGMLTGVGKEDPGPYHLFAAHLAEQGFVVFAPLVAVGNRPYPEARDRQEEVYLGIDRAINSKVQMAAALGMMRTSIEQAKLRRVIDFLQTLPFVNGKEIGYYGLSYGGYSVTWMTALEPRITASVISGHFNDWRPKITSDRIATSYLRHPDEDFSNWDVLHRFTHRELIAAMWPRAVLIEYGEHDAVTPPGWHRRAWRRLQDLARAWEMEDRIGRDYFQGNHEIYFIGALDFLNRWLHPEKAAWRDSSRYPGTPDSKAGWGPGEKAQPGLITDQIDSGGASIIRGEFYVSESAPVFSGISFRLTRAANPGDVLVRYGSEEETADVGTARVNAALVPEAGGSWVDARIVPVRLNPRKLYHFEVSVEWGWKDQGDYYVAYGPAPLGGKPIEPHFPISFRTLTKPSD